MKHIALSILIVLYILCRWNGLSAQSTNLDSLIIAVDQMESTTQKVDQILEISYTYHRMDVEKCLEYATKGLELAKTLKYTKGHSKSLTLIATTFFLKGDFENAIENGTQALDLANSINDPESILRASNTISAIYNLKQRNDKSIEYSMYALKATQDNNDTLAMISILQNLGYFHNEEKNFDESNKYYEHISKLKLHEASSEQFKISYYHGSAIHHRNKKDYQEAIRLFAKGIPIARESGDLYGLAAFHEDLGKTYIQTGSTGLAEIQFRQAMDNYQSIGAEKNYLYIVSELTKLYNEVNKYDLAVEYGTSGLELANKLDAIDDKSKLSLELAKAHEALEQIPIALHYQKDHKKWSDSVASVAKDEIILKLESDYQLTLLEKQQLKNEAIIAQEKQKNFISILLLSMATLSALFYWANYRTKLKHSKSLENEVAERTRDLKFTNEDLSVANSELERFAYISAHDLKEHIRNIGSFTGLLQRAYKDNNLKSEKISSYFSTINSSTTSMSQLVEDILKYVTVKKENIDQEVNLNETVSNIQSRLADQLEKTKGKIITQELPTITANNQHIDLLFSELIENGFKFNNDAEPQIDITYSELTTEHLISFCDNGIGLDEIYSNQAFTMFTRFNSRSEYNGSGLGLAIVNKIINILNGQVSIHSQQQGGTRVELHIPKMSSPALGLR